MDIFTTRSYPQLAATMREYRKFSKNDLHEAVRREMSFNLKRSLQTILEVVRDPMEYYCDHIYRSMAGLGTHNASLMNLIIDRSEIDLGAIKELFKAKYGQTLAECMKGEFSVMLSYKKLLMTLIGEGASH